MSDLSRSELHDLSLDANRILSEELSLHGYNVAASDGAINGGMVRAVLEALDGGGYLVILKRDARLMYGVPTDGKGEHVHFDSVTPEGKTIRILGDPNMSAETRDALGAAMDLFAKQHEGEAPAPCGDKTPLPPTDDSDRAFFGGPLPTPDELDAWGDPAPFPAPEIDEPPAPSLDSMTRNPTDGMTIAQIEQYNRAADAIREMAEEGYMPTIATYNAKKPADVPGAQYLCERLNCTWKELAAWLG